MQSGQMIGMHMNRPDFIKSSMPPQSNMEENRDILKSSMVTPEVRQITHQNNILTSGMGERIPPGSSKNDTMASDSKANMIANGPVPKTPMPIGHMRFAGAKKA
jgi:hypothetical protein